MSGILEGDVVVVTGSTRGIGRAIAEGCAAQGATVVLSARTEHAVTAAVSAFAAKGWRVAGVIADVRDADDLTCLMDLAEGCFGKVSVWVNNAGVSAGHRPLDELAPDEIRAVVDINLTGTALACAIVAPRMAAAGGGVILNMAGRGFRGEATPHTALYAATKSAVASLTRSLAAEMAGIPVRVHALVPGMVETDFYRDIVTSPKLESVSHHVHLALDAFGVPLDAVAAETPPVIARAKGENGRIYSLLTARRTARGIALMTWWRLSGRMKARG